METDDVRVLNWEQVKRLDVILTESIPIHGRWSFPTLQMKPLDIVKAVRRRMSERNINLCEVRLNGSAASHVLHQDDTLGYKDLDLIFCTELQDDLDFQNVKDIVLDALLDFLPAVVNTAKLTPLTLKVPQSPETWRVTVYTSYNLHITYIRFIRLDKINQINTNHLL